MKPEDRKVQRSYIEGNAVRKLQEVPSREEAPARRQPLTREEFERLKRKNQKQSPSVRKKRRREPSLDLKSLLFLCGAIAATLYVAVGYLRVQYDVLSMNKQIAGLESRLLGLQNDNDAELEKVNASVDLKEIYKTATKELGMVHAKENQIITYEKAASDYVRKYGDIPKVKDSILDKITE